MLISQYSCKISMHYVLALQLLFYKITFPPRNIDKSHIVKCVDIKMFVHADLS